MRRDPAYISPSEASQAITLLKHVEERLADANGGALAICIGFAKEALWAAAYPDDPYEMLGKVEQDAKNAMG